MTAFRAITSLQPARLLNFLDELRQRIFRGELNAEKDGQPLPAGEAFAELLPQALESALEGIARSALLVGTSRSNA